MKIAIDASQIIYGTGVSVYTRNLIRTLLKIDKDNEYLIIGGSLRRFKELKNKIQELTVLNKNADALLLPISPNMSDVIFNRIGFINIDAFIGKNDVFHSSDWVQPTTNSYKVTTIHDLVPLLYPKMTHPKIAHVHKRRLERVKTMADRIIVPSNNTKSDLIKMGYIEKKISVIPEAVDLDLTRPSQEEIVRVRKKYRINEKYILAVGTSYRKNIDRIISAFETIRIDRSLKLVIIGEVKKPVVVRNVSFLGHIPTPDLNKIFSGSEALIYPSLYEGFGLPILEAFYLNVPVLTSNLGSMKEIAGDAAVLIDPLDVDAIAVGIEKLLSNKEKYVKAGKEEVRKYTWDKTVAETLKVYRSFQK